MLKLSRQKYPRLFQHLMDNLRLAREFRYSEVTRDYWLSCAKWKLRILKLQEETLERSNHARELR
jgi:hypothetical protein